MNKYDAHILVVDDDDGIRDLINQYLSDQNFLITTARDAEEANQKVSIIKFDLIVLDIMMPGKTGLEFTLENKVQFQKVGDESLGVINIPDLILRNTFYYQNELFNEALFLQTGFTLNYFSEFHMNGYDPLLSEFYVQNNKLIGNFPRIDFFVNAKIQQTRIYLKAEHINSSITGYNYYSAPNYPYRDFSIRFGLVWNFFM